MTTGVGSSDGSSNDPSPSKKKGWPKGRKRRLMPKDTNAPKGPLSGYMLFMTDQREVMKQSNSKAAFSEVTKLVAQRWATLNSQTKQKYLEAAEIDKERYQRELEDYHKTDTYKSFVQRQKKEEAHTNSKMSKKDAIKMQDEEVTLTNEIPIFTEEFLNHNKSRESELRQLRKTNTDYEEQNAILQKHIDSLKCAVTKLECETAVQQCSNAALKQHLVTLRKTLAQAFANIQVPGTSMSATESNIDTYVTELHAVLTSNPHLHHKLFQNVKTIVNNVSQNLITSKFLKSLTAFGYFSSELEYLKTSPWSKIQH